jgi:hypothetical protein
MKTNLELKIDSKAQLKCYYYIKESKAVPLPPCRRQEREEL